MENCIKPNENEIKKPTRTVIGWLIHINRKDACKLNQFTFMMLCICTLGAFGFIFKKLKEKSRCYFSFVFTTFILGSFRRKWWFQCVCMTFCQKNELSFYFWIYFFFIVLCQFVHVLRGNFFCIKLHILGEISRSNEGFYKKENMKNIFINKKTNEWLSEKCIHFFNFQMSMFKLFYWQQME